ncbi:MAG: hypothetical protein WB561_05405 [Terracidiphilus sp.]
MEFGFSALPRPAVAELEAEEELTAVLDLPVVITAEPAPAPFGIHLLEPNSPTKKRKKTALWPTATETNVQLSLFD